MTRDQLIEAGRALYGERWQSPLARALGVNERTVRGWLSGRSNPAPGVEDEIRRLLAERRTAIDRILAA